MYKSSKKINKKSAALVKSVKASQNDLCIKTMGHSCYAIGDLLRLLSHPQRLMILVHLAEKKYTVTELKSVTGLSQSLLSQFLNRMKSEGIIQSDRNGKFSNYFIADQRIVKLLVFIQKSFCL
jgi:DNA-binding transcriptional ArsR family regulator